MYLENGDLVLGMHDLDHVMGAPEDLAALLADGTARTGSEAFLHALGESAELWCAGIDTTETVTLPIAERLRVLGVRRLVIELRPVMTAGPGMDLGAKPLPSKEG